MKRDRGAARGRARGWVARSGAALIIAQSRPTSQERAGLPGKVVSMDLAEYRDGLEAGIESLTGNSADVQLLLIELERQRGQFAIAQSLKEGRHLQVEGLRPMWEHEPTSEQVTSREGSDGQYIYLYWRHGRGPRPREGARCQRKTYVGSRPVQIVLAREMVANREEARRLDRAIGELRGGLRASERNLSMAAGALIRVLDRWDGEKGEGGAA